MVKDPIVEEVRKAGAKLARQAGNDLSEYFRLLREKQINMPGLIQRPKWKSLKRKTIGRQLSGKR